MSLSRLFLSAALVACLTFSTLYAIAFEYQFEAPIPAEYEVYKWRLMKKHFAQKAVGKRVLLVGDSSVLFGVNSAYIEEQLGRPVVNLALHGSAPLDFNVSMALESARSGDIVVMPLTWLSLSRDSRFPNTWFQDQLVAWGRRYFVDMSAIEKLRYVSAIAPATLYKNIVVKRNRESVIRAHPKRQLKSDEELLADFYRSYSTQSQFSYSYLNLDLHGDIQRNCGVRVAAKAPEVTPPNTEAVSYLIDAIQVLTGRGVKVFVTAQPIVDDSTTRNPEFLATMGRMWDTLRARGVPLLGGPSDYYFPPQAFFDSSYHLNCEYSIQRSKILVSALNEFLDLPAFQSR